MAALAVELSMPRPIDGPSEHHQVGPLQASSPWLNAPEATRYLRLPSVRALYQAVRRGWVPAHRIGPRQLRFHLRELDQLLGAPTSDAQR